MPKVYSEGETIEAIAKPLIGPFHPELATARLRYVFVDKASTKGGKPVFGKAKKLSGVSEYLVEADFLIEVAMDQWNDMPEPQRTALVDHLLERCTGEDDDTTGDMVWSVREPDVQEFTSILRRHGAWNADLTLFASVAKAIDIDGMIEDVGAGEVGIAEVGIGGGFESRPSMN